MSFEEFVNEWWQEYIADHDDDGFNLHEIFSQMGYNKEEYLDEDETVVDFLSGIGAEDVYDFFFGNGGRSKDIDDIPTTTDFCNDMFMRAAKESGLSDYSFTKKFVLDMAEHTDGYSHPMSFFEDLQNGCQSGMIGILVYNSDCKRIYIEHIDDMEEFVQNMEEEIGCSIKNEEHLPHYTFVCWLCYEELGYRIAQTLFPEKF